MTMDGVFQHGVKADSFGDSLLNAFGDRCSEFAIVHGLVVKRAVRLDVHQLRAGPSSNGGESADLFAYGIGDGVRGLLQFEAAKVRAIGIARMRANRHSGSKRLLDRSLHGLFIARVPP